MQLQCNNQLEEKVDNQNEMDVPTLSSCPPISICLSEHRHPITFSLLGRMRSFLVAWDAHCYLPGRSQIIKGGQQDH